MERIQFFRPWGQVGVALFVMIMGYFLGQRQSNFIKAWHRIDKLWIKTLIYSWIILICSFIFHFGIFGKRDFLYAFFPVIFDEYWFITSYIVLILLTPILNIAIKKINKKNFLILIIMVFADVVPFIKNDGTPSAPLGNMFSVGAILEYVSLIILKHGIGGLDIASFTFGLFPLITATGIFCIFSNLPAFHLKAVNWIASGVLASYLITEHPLFRMYFWHKLLHVVRYQYPFWRFALMGISIAIITVLICSILDKIYDLIFKRWKGKKLPSNIK